MYSLTHLFHPILQLSRQKLNEQTIRKPHYKLLSELYTVSWHSRCSHLPTRSCRQLNCSLPLQPVATATLPWPRTKSSLTACERWSGTTWTFIAMTRHFSGRTRSTFCARTLWRIFTCLFIVCTVVVSTSGLWIWLKIMICIEGIRCFGILLPSAIWPRKVWILRNMKALIISKGHYDYQSTNMIIKVPIWLSKYQYDYQSTYKELLSIESGSWVPLNVKSFFGTEFSSLEELSIISTIGLVNEL